MTLSEKQWQFATMLAELILWCRDEHPEAMLTFGEAHRPEWVARVYHDQGKGTMSSLHTKRLAADLNLFLNGVYQPDSESYRFLGEKWESMGGSWGGRFSRPDGNHFSLEHEGVK